MMMTEARGRGTSADVAPAKDSNGLMVLSALFIGTLFLLFLVSVLIAFHDFALVTRVGLANIPGNSFPAILGIGALFVACVYGVGFVLYCLSMPVLALPSYVLAYSVLGRVSRLARESKRVLQDDAAEILRKVSDEQSRYFDAKPSMQDLDGLLYLYLRSRHPLLSSELKFLFNQVMFARCALFSFFVAFLLPLLFDYSDAALLRMLGAYGLGVVMYVYTLLFWARSLHIVYTINVVLR
jgi:ABC-type multidrug transport system fused ATPase/permease subunit